MLEMKAITFFTLLNDMYKIDAREKLALIGIGLVPHMKEDNAKKIISSYERASSDMIELLQDNNDYSAIKELKTALK
jgi:hypothetical protein